MSDALITIGWLAIGYAIGFIHIGNRMMKHLELFMETYHLAKNSYKDVFKEQRETIIIQRQTIREQKKIIERLLKT